MEVYAASRRDLANAIQSYNDNDSITFISGANLLKNVELSYRSGEKLLDVSQILTEKGEPMVFYHGTNRAFDEFDLSKSAGMAMFTSSEALAKQFAGRWPMYERMVILSPMRTVTIRNMAMSCPSI